MDVDLDKKNLKPLDIIVLVLSIYVLGALIADSIFILPSEVSTLLFYIDNIICVLFLIDFTMRFYVSDSKLKFMKWGWIDLISSIPLIGFLRAGRVFRLIRLIRILRAFRSTRQFMNHIFVNKAQGAFTSFSAVAILLVIFSAISVLYVETDPNSNIKTAEDSLWWAYVTITTVGYGDKFPVTTEGRIIASILMTFGVGLYGSFTALIASWFVSEK